ncbi:MAG: DinB family protein [Bacteroidetes bacterium]|nr:DinB family protein [Bacteroidota bacterium]
MGTFINPDFTISNLSCNSDVFRTLFSDVSEQEYLWKPPPNKWCLLEIVCHLYDEEREDFRARVKHVLENPELPMASIDPVNWVTKRKYIERNYSEMIEKFLEERKQSVVWLKSLKEPKWENTYNHTQIGTMTAYSFLNNWLAHDYFHFRQIVRTKYRYLQQVTGDKLIYAGEW